MFEQAFRNIDDALRKEAGCATELDYSEQTSWLIFLKYLDSLEQDRAAEATLAGKKYTYLLDKPFRWGTWAAPKGKDGKIDHNAAKTGDDLREFVDDELFPYLQEFKDKASGPNTIEYKIVEIFGEHKSKITSGYNLREIIEQVDQLRFRSQAADGPNSSQFEWHQIGVKTRPAAAAAAEDPKAPHGASATTCLARPRQGGRMRSNGVASRPSRPRALAPSCPRALRCLVLIRPRRATARACARAVGDRRNAARCAGQDQRRRREVSNPASPSAANAPGTGTTL